MDPLQSLTLEVAALKARLLNAPLLHRKDVERRYGWHKSTLDRMRNRGLLPPPRRLCRRHRGRLMVGRTPFWTLADLEACERTGVLPSQDGRRSASGVRLKNGVLTGTGQADGV